MNQKLILQKNNYRVGIYCRLSKDDNKVIESNSIKSQKESLTEYVKHQNWKLHKIYIDDGFSGVSFDRPAFKSMIQDIERDKINCVVVKDLSRLGRNYLDSGYYIEKYFPEHNVRFIAVNDAFDSSEGENDFGPFKNIINEWYAKDISKKIKFSFNTKAKQGNLIQGIAPYGYVRVGNSLEYKIDEEAAKVIKFIFKSIYHKIPAKEVIESLKKNKVYVPGYYNYLKKGVFKEKYKCLSEDKKYDWNYWKLQSILTNEIYVGTLVNFKRRKVSFRSKKLVPNDNDKILKIKDRFPAIVSQEVFDTVKEIRNKKYRASRTKHKEFTNLIFCGDCGKKIILRKQGQHTNKEQYYFYCAKETGGCGGHYIRLDVLKELILKDFQNIQGFISSIPKEVLLSKLNEYNQKKILDKQELERKEYDRVKKRITELQHLISTLLDTYTKGLLPEDSYQLMLTGYKKEYESLISKEKVLASKLENPSLLIHNPVSQQQLEKILSLDSVDLFENHLLRSIVQSISIFDSTKEDKIVRTIKIEYYNLGFLRGSYYGK